MNSLSQSQSNMFALFLVLATLSSGCYSGGPPTEQTGADEVVHAKSRAVTRVARKYDGIENFLADDERAVLASVHQKYQDILEDWHGEHGEKIRSGREAVADFLREQDKRKARQATEQAKKDNVKELILDEREMQKEYEAAVVAAIPAEEFKLWQADRISKTLLEFLEPLGLTEEQTRQVYELAPSALKKVRDRDKLAWHVIGTASLEELVGRRVISASQKKPFEELKKENRMRKLRWAL